MVYIYIYMRMPACLPAYFLLTRLSMEGEGIARSARNGVAVVSHHVGELKPSALNC